MSTDPATANGGGGGENSSGRDPRGIALSALVVILALGLLTLSVRWVLDSYDTTACGVTCQKERTEEKPGIEEDISAASSSATVAVLTPITAGIVAVAGLFFGFSAAGSAKGRQAEATEQVATATAAVAKSNEEVGEAINEHTAAVQQSGVAPPVSPAPPGPPGDVPPLT